jgi:hypothetical protein
MIPCFSSLSIREDTAGADKNTFDANCFKGYLAFSCKRLINIASILSIKNLLILKEGISVL